MIKGIAPTIHYAWAWRERLWFLREGSGQYFFRKHTTPQMQ